MAKVKQRKGIRTRGATRADAPAVPRAPSTATRTTRAASSGRQAGAGAANAATKRSAGKAASAPTRVVTKTGVKTRGTAKRATAVPAAKKAVARGKALAGRVSAGGRKGAPTAAPGRGSRAPVVPERVVRIKELDPYAKCGPATSVVHLYRVDECLNGLEATHLVFFDRHGWYCEHGRGCRAVEDVRKVVKTVAGSTLARTI